MQIELTERDRRDLWAHAWNMTRKLPLPRKVRLLLAIKLVLDLTPRLKEAREKELNDKWTKQALPPNPTPPQTTPSGLLLLP